MSPDPAGTEPSASPSRWRLFVALPVPEAVQEALGKAQDQLRAVLPAGVASWTRPDKLHLTLRFLGDLDSSCVSALQEGLAGALAGFGPLSLTAARLECFPDLSRPRVLYAAVQDRADRLRELQGKVAAATAGFVTDPKPDRFVGHLTLARFKAIRRHSVAVVARHVHEAEGRRFGDWTADRVELIRSELLSAGSRYTVLAAIGL